MQYWSYDKIQIPKLGFGTYCLQGKNAVSAVKWALETGLRHIDTAAVYDNEEEVGLALKEASIPREEIFITTKLWFDCLDKKGVKQGFQQSLQKLQTDYVDLLLIHWPNPKIDLEESLGALMRLKEEKKIHHIGVSNFTCRLLQQAKKICPSLITNQVEYHPLLSQQKLLRLIDETPGMFLTAYSPLIRGKVNQIQQIIKIAKKYNKSPSQIALKWLIGQKNVVAIFKSGRKERIVENSCIFDFELEKEDQEQLFRLNHNKQRLINPPFSPDWDS